MRSTLIGTVFSALLTTVIFTSAQAAAGESIQPWSCPDSKVWLKCGELHDDLDYYGYPKITKDYHHVTVYGPEVKEHLDDCGRGYIHRKWKIKYHYDWYTCSQHIYVGEQSGSYSDFDPHYHMNWPRDYDMHSCHGSMHPDNMPSSYGWPKMKSHYGGCSKVGLHYTDKTHPVHGYSGYGYNKPCKVVHRTWEIIDWCQYDKHSWHWEGQKKVYKGQWFYTQKIYLYDNEEPTITSCPTDTAVVSGDCNGEKVHVQLAKLIAKDNCGDVWISYSKKHLGDGYGSHGSGSHSVKYNGADASGYFKPGKTEVHYLAVDVCGNASECKIVVEVEAKDTKPPQVIAISSITLTLMQTDSNDGMREVNPLTFNSSSYDNCTAKEDLKFSVEPNMFTCADFGSNDVKFIVEDAAGNSSYAMVEVIVQSGGFDCMGGNVSGMVLGNAGGVSNVNIQLMDKMPGLSTGQSGLYTSNQIPLGYDLAVKPSKSDELLKGVDMFDYVLLSLHVDGMREITDPLAMIAADIDGNGTLNQQDVYALQRVIAGVDTDFGANQPWKFIRADYQMPDSVSPLEASLDATYKYEAYAGEEMTFDFKAIKIGDVGATPTADPEGHLSTVEVQQSLDDIGSASIDIRATDHIGYFQIPLTTDMTLDEISSNLTEADGKLDLVSIGDDRYLLSWYAYPDAGTSFDRISLQLMSGTQSNRVRVDANHTMVQVAQEASEVDVEYVITAGDTRIMNYPNPFVLQTALEFNWDEPGAGELTVRSATGKIIYTRSLQLQRGANRLLLTNDQIPGVGVFTYAVRTGDKIKMGKMLKVD